MKQNLDSKDKDQKINTISETVTTQVSSDNCNIANSVVSKTKEQEQKYKVFKCDRCHKSFIGGDLQRHLRMHARKKYKCDYCPYEASHENHLTAHVGKHTGKKPFDCDTCGYSCSTQSILTSHMKIHSEKKYKCNLCEYTCVRKMRLVEHVRTHTGEKPFPCDICGYECSQISTLRKHKKAVHAAYK